MKTFSKYLVLSGVLVGALCAHANAQTVTVDPTQLTLGYMNWSPAPGDAAGYGGASGGPWGVSDLRAVFSGSTLTLSPNTNVYAPGNNYWVNADGSGANIMDANVYSETTGIYVGTTLTFTFDVLSDNLASNYTSVAFIKDFNSGYGLVSEQTVALAPGVQTISLLTSANPTDHIQYGFETDGPDANPATASSLGDAVITTAPVPEPSCLALLGLGLLGALVRRRQ